MNQCASCSIPITAGQEKWARNKETGERIAFCPECAAAMRGEKKAPAAAVQMPPPPAAEKPAASRSLIPLGGWLLLILFGLVGGLLAGALVFGVSRFIYLIILFPIVMGAAAGYLIAKAVRAGKVRHAGMAALAAVVTGFIIYGAFWAGEYLAFRSDVRGVIMEEMGAGSGEADSVAADQFVDLVLEAEVGRGGVPGFVLLSAREGMEIGRFGRGQMLNIGQTLTWIYWLVEIGLIALIAAGVAMDEAGKPFCTAHDRWYEPNELVGGVEPEQADTAMHLLQTGQYVELGEMMDPEAPAPGLAFYAASCRDCLTSEPVLTVTALSVDSRQRVKSKDLAKQAVSPQAHAALWQAVRPAV